MAALTLIGFPTAHSAPIPSLQTGKKPPSKDVADVSHGTLMCLQGPGVPMQTGHAPTHSPLIAQVMTGLSNLKSALPTGRSRCHLALHVNTQACRQAEFTLSNGTAPAVSAARNTCRWSWNIQCGLQSILLSEAAQI